MIMSYADILMLHWDILPLLQLQSSWSLKLWFAGNYPNFLSLQFSELTFVLLWMHDYVTCWTFTTTLRLREIVSKLWHLRVVLTKIFFSSLLLWKFAIYGLKVVLGGEIGLSLVIVHKCYFNRPREGIMNMLIYLLIRNHVSSLNV